MFNINSILATAWTLPVVSTDAISLNWIGKLIKLLIEGIGITGVGIIVFTLILKTLVLPLDVYSRRSSKKQALIMEQMREPMEKLQKQYANDKNMYNQKVMELYKKNGYSMFSACVPMIVSLVIFIIVFNAFSAYSQYANLELYRGMVNSYSTSVVQFDKHDNSVQDGFLSFSYVCDGKTYYIADDGSLYEGSNTYTLVDGKYVDADGKETGLTKDNLSEHRAYDKIYIDYTAFLAYYEANGYYKIQDENGNVISAKTYLYGTENIDALVSRELVESENIVPYDSVKDLSVRDYYINYNANQLNNRVGDYVKVPARDAAADYYHNNGQGFLWIKNIWYPDSMLTKEFPSFKDFASSTSKANLTSIAGFEQSYNEVTGNLVKEKSTFNGYFVLIVLSIGLMLLQQWISMKSTKATADLGSVDGSANNTNRTMMIMMPIIYGVFAFMYSASFSIYMITNTIYSIITTLIVNKILDVQFAKKMRELEVARLTGRTRPKTKK